MKITNIEIKQHSLEITTDNNQVHCCRLDQYERLKKASNEQLQDYYLTPMGIHWPEVDEDLLFAPIIGISEFDDIELKIEEIAYQ